MEVLGEGVWTFRVLNVLLWQLFHFVPAASTGAFICLGALQPILSTTLIFNTKTHFFALMCIFKLVMRLNIFHLFIGYFFKSKLFTHFFFNLDLLYKVNNLFILIVALYFSQLSLGDFFLLILRKSVSILTYRMYFFCVYTFFLMVLIHLDLFNWI